MIRDLFISIVILILEWFALLGLYLIISGTIGIIKKLKAKNK